MNKIGSIGWDPERDLAVLLDALTAELLTASDRQVALSVRETGGQPDMMVREMHRLMAAAEADVAVPPASGFTSPGLRAYVARNH
jgi:hypothetical protein